VTDPTRRGHVIAVLLTLVAAGALLWYLSRLDSASESPDASFPTTPEAAAWPTEDATWVGTAKCAECHEEAFEAHRDSHHDHATDLPGEETVLAPFDGRTFERDGFHATFSREGERYLVHAEEHDYDVGYTFGFYPLQQYLLDVGRGRFQAFSVAWDARPPEAGGQRFFDPRPELFERDDPRHWTREDQSWNAECADCHSTAVERGWSTEQERFDTTFAELDVGCEACHGPGSVHVAWAERGASGVPQGLAVTLRRASSWTIDDGEATAESRSMERGAREVEVCAACHSRRDPLVERHRPGSSFLDGYRPELLSRRLYHHDGQIDGEVYEYGSFLQSRMFHAGVRCSDCHDPHSLALRREGDALCTGCHRPSVYENVEHHHHEGAGSACVDCHMVEKLYSAIDGRRDHSFRVPRPDLAASLGVPDACTGCHEDEGSAWAAARVVEWFGEERRPHWGTALHAARRREPDAAESLRDVAADEGAPAIVRATALALLDDFPGPVAEEALSAGARSPEPLVRLGATYGTRDLEPEARWRLVGQLATDEMRAVRVEAARTLAVVPVGDLEPSQSEALSAAVDELLEVERRFAHRPDAWLRVGLLELDRGDEDAAGRAWRRALALEPRFTPAMVSLADLRRAQGDEVEAEALLRRAIAVDDTDADAFHALGLLLVRTERTADATPFFTRAVDLRADNPRFHYVLAVALHDGGDLPGAIEALERGVDAHQNDPDLLRTLATYADEAGDHRRAAEVRAMLERLGD
jgi:predicted CXXCH cytochrome family protein